jgi:transposase-like protein
MTSDGAPGQCAALDQVFPGSSRQRCLVHKARNVLAKVSEADQDRVKADFWEIFAIPEEIAPGAAAIAEARRRAEQFAETWGAAYPRAVACVLDDLDLLVAHLAFPRAHWPRIRHTNLIERTFGETRRRVKVIGRLPGERSCLSLLWAVLERAAAGWRGITYTPADVRLLQGLRRHQQEPGNDIVDRDEEAAQTAAA